jgi:hypothetical protein
MLTKTDFLRYLECPIHLWLHKHQPHHVGSHVINPQLKWVFEQGNMVEAQARRMFPDGKLVKGHSEASKAQTDKLIATGATTIFQATAIDDGIMAMADIFRYNKKTKCWDIFEVKSATDVKEGYAYDVCFQRIAFRKAGYKVGRLTLVHVNGEYVKNGEIDPKKFLILQDITEQADAIEETVEQGISAALALITHSELPPRDQVTCTCTPKHCPCVQFCYPDLPEYSIFNLTYIHVKKAQDLYAAGIRIITDLPEDFPLTEAQSCQMQCARTGKPIVAVADIQSALSDLKYPIHFFDYETFFPAIPLFDGYKPYQQMVFQYSLHTLKSPDGELEHKEHLAMELVDPAPKILAALAEHMCVKGTVVVWNKSFEMNRNKEMAESQPKFAKLLHSINDRVFDLMEIFRKHFYVHPDFRGSCSIKDILPVLVPQLSYKTLTIQEGGTASLTWYRMLTDGRNEEEKHKTCADLLAYCKLDTLAMVEIYRSLRIA